MYEREERSQPCRVPRLWRQAKQAHDGKQGDGAEDGSSGHGDSLPLALVCKDFAAHLQNSLEALSSTDGILPEAFDGEVLDAVLDLLPATAEGNDLGILVEDGAGVGCRGRGSVNDGLANGKQIGPGHVDAAHGDLFLLGVNIGRLVDMRGFLAAEERI